MFRLPSYLLLGLMTFFAGCEKEFVPSETTDVKTKGVVANNAAARNAITGAEVLQTVGNGTFYLMNRNSGKVMDVLGFGTADGTGIIQYGGAGSTNQQFTLTQRTGGYYSIIGIQSGKAVQVTQSATTDGAEISIGTYTGANNQQWQFVSTGNGNYRIVNRNSGKVLGIYGGSIDDAANVVQWTSDGTDNQQWGLITTNAGGQLRWVFTTSSMPDDVRTRITNAMNDACARYNALANWPSRTLTIEYNTGVGTADGSTNGNIRFGGNTSYQNTRTAMHEIGHTYGVGGSSGWYANTSSGPFTGVNAVTTLKSFDGENAVINTGGSHFWPYGLNYDSEWSESSAYRHVKMIFAMRADGM